MTSEILHPTPTENLPKCTFHAMLSRSKMKNAKNGGSNWDRTWPLKVVIEGLHVDSALSTPSTPLSCNSRVSATGSIEENNNQKFEDDQCRCQFYVRGDWSVRQVIRSIAEEAEKRKITHDWSDYALWWPKQKRWLKKVKASLDQYEVHADEELHFTPMHKMLRFQLPNRRVDEAFVDFSVPVVQSVFELCAKLDVRHPEELSFSRPLTVKMLRTNLPTAGLSASELQRPTTPSRQTASRQFSGTFLRTNSPHTPTLSTTSVTFSRQPSNNLLDVNGKSKLSISSNSLNSVCDSVSNMSLAGDAGSRTRALRPKTIVERARLNSTWLNSSRSLYEQDVKPHDMLDLRFKFYDFADLDPSKDLARIDYIYEQLRWSVVSDEIEASDETVYTLAAISLQVAIKSRALDTASSGHASICESPMFKFAAAESRYLDTKFPELHMNPTTHLNGNGLISGGNGRGSYSSGTGSPLLNDDQIDSALDGLERSLDKSVSSTSPTTDSLTFESPYMLYTNDTNDLLVVPELKDRLRLSTTKGPQTTGTMRRFLGSNDKSLVVCLRETILKAYKVSEDKDIAGADLGDPALAIDLLRCEVHPMLQVSQNRFEFTIVELRYHETSSAKNRTVTHSVPYHHLIRCKDERQYAKWFTACKHATSGRTMANSSYGDDVNKTLRLLQIQSAIKPNTIKEKTKNKNKSNGLSEIDTRFDRIDLADYVPKRILKRKSREQILQKIKLLHHSFAADPAIEAQLTYIRTAKSLIKDFGVTLFIIKQVNSKKEELLGISPNKIQLFDASTGQFTSRWKYSNLYDWNVNWEVKRMTINFRTVDSSGSGHNEELEFDCLSADCKIIHEYIGGYIYMSLRYQSAGSFEQHFDQDKFLELTGDQEDVEDDYRKMAIDDDRENIRPVNYVSPI